MAENMVSKLSIGGLQYTIKDANALRKADVVSLTSTATDAQAASAKDTYDKITAIESAIAGGIHFLGVTRTAIQDGATIGDIEVKDGSSWKTISGSSIKDGDFVVTTERTGTGPLSLEFIAAGGKWYELGSSGQLGALAFKDSATGSYTPQGSITTSEKSVTGTVTTNVSVKKVSGVTATFVGKGATISANYTPAGTVTGTVGGTTSASVAAYTPAGTIGGTATGSATVTMNYTPAGTVSKPSITVTPTTKAVFNTASLDADDTEMLVFGTTNVMTDATADLDAIPTFTGTEATLTTKSATCSVAGNTLTFTGTQRNAYTLSGTCSTVVDGTTGKKLTFVGTAATIEAQYTPQATSVTVADFTPEAVNGTTTHTLTAPGQTASLTGTQATITVS